MPDLPTITLDTQDQYDRVMSAFPGSTPEETNQAYHDWMINRLVERVRSVESAKAIAAVEAALPNLTPEPPLDVTGTPPDPTAP